MCNRSTSALAKYLKYSRHKNTDALLTAQHPVTLKVSIISYHTLYDYWRETINKHPQLQLCRIHDLRHTFATERVGLISIEELCSLMGHESIQTTLRYAKVTSQKSESAARHALNLGVQVSSEQKTGLSLKVLSCKDFIEGCSS